MCLRAVALGLIVLVGASIQPCPAARAAAGRAPQMPGTVYTQWIAVDPLQPRTIFAAGGIGCAASPGGAPCPGQAGVAPPSWLARSDDGGRSWVRLEHAAGLDTSLLCTRNPAPPVLVPGTSRVYVRVDIGCGSPAGTSTDLLQSFDGGLHWHTSIQGGEYGGGAQYLAVSPAAPDRLYAAVYTGGTGSGAYELRASIDAGRSWPVIGDPLSPAAQQPAQPYTLQRVVPDPQRAGVAYADFVPLGGGASVAGVSRSLDGGRTWGLLSPPASLAPAAGFSVNLDSHLPGILVGRSTDPATPEGRIYLSTDSGTTWQLSFCPGIMNGRCPAWTLDNVFGSGASYAFFPDGVHAFRGAGPAGPRLALSDRLPVPMAALLAVAGGVRAGDPVYLLARQGTARVPAVLYRSLDAGQTWVQVPVAPPLNALPPDTAPGAVLVPQTRHSVAAPFVPTYRRLGVAVAGYPLTEAYRSGDALVQLFEHLRLELHGTRVVVGSLGSEEFDAHLALGDPALAAYQYGEGAVRPVPDTPSRLYFPQTRHTLSGDLLAFWRAHGGLGVLGAPLTEVITGTNGDGTGRRYQMQYFTRARLERHPEHAGTRYAIQLGLLGDEWLVQRGWLVTRVPRI